MNDIISDYQTAFADRFNVSNAFAFWKGRVALYAILKAMGIGPGDEVILPGYTCMVNVNPIKYLGAKPIYVDIEPKTFNLNIGLLEEKISSKTKVIITQHTYGYVCDMDPLLQIADRNNVPVIEDCCLCLGSTYKNKLAGTFGKAAYFSFQWNKPFTTGLGGMAITNDAKLAEKIKHLCDEELCKPSVMEVIMLTAQLAVYRMVIYPSTTAIAQNIFRYLTKKGAVVGSFSTAEFNPVMAPDFFKSVGPVQARSGIRQLARIDSNIAHRRKLAALYDRLLWERGWVPRKYDKSVMDPVMVRYPLRITEKSKALEEAAAAGVELGSWFECPLHPRQTPMEMYDYKIGMCPMAEKAAREVVNLPLHPRAGEKTAKRTVDFITRFAQAT
jgi:dTDP-4-amino-4,6-dideoxygalactose transaminase